MIERNDYRLLMQVMLETATEAKSPDEFAHFMDRLIITSYEINNPEHGECIITDVTGDLIESMGRHWAAFTKLGIQKVEFVQYKLDGLVILETGRMEGHGQKDVALDTIRSLPNEVLRSFAKGLVLSMRECGSMILQEMIEEGGDTKHHLGGDSLDLSALIREFLDEEVDETVAKFSRQLDSVFGVADSITQPWSAPKGVRHDDPSPL